MPLRLALPVLAGTVLAALAPVAAAPVLTFDAAGEAAGDGRWRNDQGLRGFDLRFDGGRRPDPVAVADPWAPGLTAAYRFDGFGATGSSFHRVRPRASRQDAAWELWLRPERSAGQQVVFETGGNVYGTALLMEDDELVYLVQSGNTQRSMRLAVDLGETSGDRFHHVVGVTDFDEARPGQGSIHLFIDGAEAASAEWTAGPLTQWAGSNGTGLGRKNSSIPGGNGRYDPFSGLIASLTYHDEALDAIDVAGRYARFGAPAAGGLAGGGGSAVPEPASMLVLAGAGACLLRRLPHRRRVPRRRPAG